MNTSKQTLLTICLLTGIQAQQIESMQQNMPTFDQQASADLLVAARENSLKNAKRALLRNANMHTRTDGTGSTSLHVACTKGNFKIATFLIYNGANIEAFDYENDTPLDNACSQGHNSLAKYLVRKGASINRPKEKSPFHLVCVSGNLPLITYFLKKGANPEAYDYWGLTPLCTACNANNIKAVKTLVRSGLVDIDEPSEYGSTPLHFACKSGAFGIASFLIQQGASLHARNDFRNIPLHTACKYGKHWLINLLLANGSPIDALNAQDETPLHLASKKGHVKAIRKLLAKGTHVDAFDKNNYTPLHHACWKGQLEATKLLIRNGANINAIAKDDSTPIYWACESDNLQLVELLLMHGCLIDALTLEWATGKSQDPMQTPIKPEPNEAAIKQAIIAHRAVQEGYKTTCQNKIYTNLLDLHKTDLELSFYINN